MAQVYNLVKHDMVAHGTRLAFDFNGKQDVISFDSCFQNEKEILLRFRTRQVEVTLLTVQFLIHHSTASNHIANSEILNGERHCVVKVKVEVSHYDCFDVITNKWFRLLSGAPAATLANLCHCGNNSFRTNSIQSVYFTRIANPKSCWE